MVLSRNGFGLNLYWYYKNSHLIARYQFKTSKLETKELSRDNSIFIGVDHNEKIYLYSASSRIISVYDYDSGLILQQIEYVLDSDVATMHDNHEDPSPREFIVMQDVNPINIWST